MKGTEAAVQSELKRALAVLTLIVDRLQALAAGLPAEPGRRDRQRRRAARLRSTIECLVTDSLKPAVEGLRASLGPPAPEEGAGKAARWSEEVAIDRPWPFNLPVPAEILELLDLAPGDVAALDVEPAGRRVLHPHRQWLRMLPAPWGQAEGRALLDFLLKDMAFIAPSGLVVLPPTLPLAPGDRVVLELVERQGACRLAFSRVAAEALPAPPAAPDGEEGE